MNPKILISLVVLLFGLPVWMLPEKIEVNEEKVSIEIFGRKISLVDFHAVSPASLEQTQPLKYPPTLHFYLVMCADKRIHGIRLWIWSRILLRWGDYPKLFNPNSWL